MSTFTEADHWSIGMEIACERLIANDSIVPSIPAKNVVCNVQRQNVSYQAKQEFRTQGDLRWC